MVVCGRFLKSDVRFSALARNMTSLWSYTQIEIGLPNGGRSINHFGKEHDDNYLCKQL
jgi:hypothetical protein